MRYLRITYDKVHSCKSLLTLTDSRTKLKSGANVKDIGNAVKIINNGGKTSFSRSERMTLISQVKKFGVKQAAGTDTKKKAFLEEVFKGKNAAFVEDVVFAYENLTPAKAFSPPLGSDEYFKRIEKKIFLNPDKLSAVKQSKSYKELIVGCLQKVRNSINSHLDEGIKNDDYLKDDKAGVLKESVKQIEKCAVTCNGLEDKIDSLAWFVGGDPEQIRELQRGLNSLGLYGTSGQLKEDGVYNKNTHAAWNGFLNTLEKGFVPTLNWIKPLEKAGLKIADTAAGRKLGVNNALADTTTGHRYLYIDTPHGNETNKVFRGKKVAANYYHINIRHPGIEIIENDKLRNLKSGKELIQYLYNHKKISPSTFNLLKNFDGVAKTVKTGGRVLLVAGFALDLLELGVTIETDLKDVDKKLGKKTISTAVRIGGRWTGAISGAKLGASIGAKVASGGGPLVQAAGVAGGSLVLGIVGSFAGDKLAEFVVDVTIAEE